MSNKVCETSSISCGDIWTKCLSFIEDNIEPASFKTWFKSIPAVKLVGTTMFIKVPSQFYFEYLEEHYIEIISAALRKELGSEAKLEYLIISDSRNTGKDNDGMINYPSNETPNLRNRALSFPEPLHGGGVKNPFVIPGTKKLEISPQLNPKYSMGNFVEGGCNKFGRAAGKALAESPGSTTFNPLFVFGGSGLGKTHLAQAIGIEVKKKYPDKVVLFVNAVTFGNQFTTATLKNEVPSFLHFYNQIDILIVDDVQEFIGKKKTEETFFHIFSHLHGQDKQLILTSDKSPANLTGLEDRLLSRFKWGLTVELTTPDYDTRLEILKQKRHHDGIQISDEILEYLAYNVKTNIRELEGILVSLLAQSTILNMTITLEMTQEVVDKIVKVSKNEITIDSIKKLVCEFFEVEEKVLIEKSRKREAVQARQVAMYFAKLYTKNSLAVIGAQIGDKDHATVLHACKTVTNILQTDKVFKSQLENLDKKIKSNM